jgi:hypothetical protein
MARMQAGMAMGKSRRSHVQRFSIGFISRSMYPQKTMGLSRLRSYLLTDTQNGMERGRRRHRDVKRAADALATDVSNELLSLIRQ